jgi:hypothetical protein
MISAIIFSKNRASQLHLLIESMFNCSYKLFDNITVLYTTTDEAYEKGYYLLQQQQILPTKITWIKESNLTKDTLESMQGSIGNNKFITFLTDDSVFYKNIQEKKVVIETALHPASDIACFSLRIGLNTVEQMYWAPGHILKLNYTQVNDIIKWKHTEYPTEHHYGYPLSLDGHIFPSSKIVELIQKIDNFQGVNALEGCLTRYKFEIPSCMAAFEHSALVTVPINRVQELAKNTAGLFHGISTEELNNKYLAGKTIDYRAIDFSKINGTHQELRYTFRR